MENIRTFSENYKPHFRPVPAVVREGFVGERGRETNFPGDTTVWAEKRWLKDAMALQEGLTSPRAAPDT